MPSINTVLQYFELIAQAVLVLGLVFFAWTEWRKPRVSTQPDKWPRWQTNLALYVLGAVFMALAFDPLSGYAIGLGGTLGWGGLAATTWPTWVKLVIGLLVIDVLQYALHVASHYVPWWWRLHKIHHSDTSMDASTAIRHHPLETMLNAFVLVVLLAAGGVPVYAIFLYAALQQVHALFCHANLALPETVDRSLRWYVVTPDMHAIHHSIRMDEGNSNFAMVFPWWDHIFRTYCHRPQQGRVAMRMGIAELAARRKLQLLDLLGLPFWPARQGAPVATTRSVPQRRAKRRR
jgi:sterol desaturase/sphingolipid hydroxylase (fatty acid hydroxylase superfamily)